MINLRKIGILALGAIMVLGILGVLAALMNYWVLALVFVFGALLVTAVTILLASRYFARQARTIERKSTTAVHRLNEGVSRLNEDVSRLAERIEVTMQRITESASEQRRLYEATHQAIEAVEESTSDVTTAIGQKVDGLEANVHRICRSNARHVTATVRDSTRQVESLVQIYTRISDTKLPMPNTGGFAIDAQALGHLIALIEERRPRRILELGSGTSTIWIGYLCRSSGGELVTLDHLEEYLTLTRAAVDRHELNDHVECRLAPLEEIDCDGNNYPWYSTAALSDLSDIDMVFIDGPPAATGPEARFPALPTIIDMLSSNATVILDDAHRQEESDIIASWQKAFPDFTLIEEGTSRLAVLERRD